MVSFIAGLLVVLIIVVGVAARAVLSFREDVDTAIKALTRSVEHQIGRVVDGQRLSIILDLKGGDLLIKPEQFEPNREKLLTRVLQKIDEGDNDDPDTWAYCVLSRSGLDLFLESNTRQKVQKAFARLRVNDDMNGARALAHDIMKQL